MARLRGVFVDDSFASSVTASLGPSSDGFRLGVLAAATDFGALATDFGVDSDLVVARFRAAVGVIGAADAASGGGSSGDG